MEIAPDLWIELKIPRFLKYKPRFKVFLQMHQRECTLYLDDLVYVSTVGTFEPVAMFGQYGR